MRTVAPIEKTRRAEAERVHCQGSATLGRRPTRSLGSERLFVITDTAAQIADPGYETHLRKRRRGGARLRKHVALQLSDLTFRLLRRSVDCLTIRIAGGVLKGSNVRASWNSLRTGEGLPVRDSETEWIQIGVQEPALTLEEHRYRHDLVRLYSGDRLVEHGPSLLVRAPLLRERGGRERESRHGADHKCAEHWILPCLVWAPQVVRGRALSGSYPMSPATKSS